MLTFEIRQPPMRPNISPSLPQTPSLSSLREACQNVHLHFVNSIALPVIRQPPGPAPPGAPPPPDPLLFLIFFSRSERSTPFRKLHCASRHPPGSRPDPKSGQRDPIGDPKSPQRVQHGVQKGSKRDPKGYQKGVLKRVQKWKTLFSQF